MIEESIRLDWNVMKLFMKVIPIIIYYICTSHGISSISYRGIKEEIVGIGQGNIMSGNVRMDKSCLTI